MSVLRCRRYYTVKPSSRREASIASALDKDDENVSSSPAYHNTALREVIASTSRKQSVMRRSQWTRRLHCLRALQ